MPLGDALLVFWIVCGVATVLLAWREGTRR